MVFFCCWWNSIHSVHQIAVCFLNFCSIRRFLVYDEIQYKSNERGDNLDRTVDAFSTLHPPNWTLRYKIIEKTIFSSQWTGRPVWVYDSNRLEGNLEASERKENQFRETWNFNLNRSIVNNSQRDCPNWQRWLVRSF